jgi:hypothetical protein
MQDEGIAIILVGKDSHLKREVESGIWEVERTRSDLEREEGAMRCIYDGAG